MLLEPLSFEDFSDEDLGIGISKYGEKTRADRIACMEKVEENFPICVGLLTKTEIMKFCKGQAFEYEKVATNLEFHLEWRQRVSIDDPSSLHYTKSKKFGSGDTYVAGYSKKGNLVVVMRPAFSQRHQSNPNEYITYERQDFEEAHAHGYRAYTIPSREIMGDVMNYVIIDCKGYWLTDFSRAQSKIEAESFMKNFPEMMEKVFIINAPWGLQSVFNIAKMFLEPLTREKFVFVNKPATLLEYIDADVLEKEYGGNHEPYSRKTLSPEVTVASMIDDLRDKNVSDFLQIRCKHFDTKSIANKIYPTRSELHLCKAGKNI